MKKHKFSSHQPEALGVSPLDTAAAALLLDSQQSSAAAGDVSRVRSNSYTAKDHGYETIPAGGQNLSQNQALHENRKSDCYAANMLQMERQQEAGKNSILRVEIKISWVKRYLLIKAIALSSLQILVYLCQRT